MYDRDSFEDWLIEMDNRLEALFKELPKDVVERLDYTPGSLSVLERWLLSNYQSVDEAVAKDKYLLNRLASYVGETFRKTSGGIWTIDLSNEDSAFYGIPIISREGKPPEAPLTLVSAALNRRRGTYMQPVLTNS